LINKQDNTEVPQKENGGVTVRPTDFFHIRLVQDEFERRTREQPRYSLRSFSASMEVHVSEMSRFLSGKRDMSAPACARIFQHMDLTSDDRQRFLESIAMVRSLRYQKRVERLLERFSGGAGLPALAMQGAACEAHELM
jgi:hypothetical protein